MLVHYDCCIFCYENLRLSGKRGALVRAISNMPKDEQIFITSSLKAEWITGNPIETIPVNPRNTSTSSHYHCPGKKAGKISRTAQNWDIAECLSCHKKIMFIKILHFIFVIVD